MSAPRIVLALYPHLLLTESEFRPGYGLLLEDQRITLVDKSENVAAEVERRRDSGQYVTTRRLPNKALMPGLVNTHSHAFQRGIRGRTEYPDASRGSEDFWSWRGLMYEAARRLTPEDVEALALGCYVEMVKAGYTRVGEFHYVHHQPDGRPYEDPNELAWRVLRAARGAGIHTTLLRAYYRRAGVGRPEPEGAQKMFCDRGLDLYFDCLERLRKEGHLVGVTPHSVRAVPAEELTQLIVYAKEHSLPWHIHVSEQPREIEECLSEHGLRPVQLLEQLGALDGSLTTGLVHAIHLEPDEIAIIGKARSFLASCPTTERNLGDGVVPARALQEAGARFTFGTDSQCQLAPFEEARQLEYHLRLKHLKRSVLFDDADQAARGFLHMLTLHGSDCLGAPGGSLAEGSPSDLIAIDLEHLSLAGWTPQSLPLDLIFSAAPDVVSDVWVGGVEVVVDRRHRSQDQAVMNLHRVLKKLRTV